MNAKVTYTNETSDDRAVGTECELIKILEDMDATHCKIRDFLFVDMEENIYVVRESRNEVVDIIENSFSAIADFLAMEFDLDLLMRSEIKAINVKKVEITF